MRWILDDGPLGQLASTVDPAEAVHWQAGVLLVAEATAGAAIQAPDRQALLDVRVGGEPIVEIFGIRLGSDDPAEQVFIELRPGAESTNDLAEHESIAWAQAHGLDAVFVCADRRATLTALAELGRQRVAHPFDVWLDLLERGWLTPGAFERVCHRTRVHDQGLPRMPSRVSDFLRRDAEDE